MLSLTFLEVPQPNTLTYPHWPSAPQGGIVCFRLFVFLPASVLLFLLCGRQLQPCPSPVPFISRYDFSYAVLKESDYSNISLHFCTSLRGLGVM